LKPPYEAETIVQPLKPVAVEKLNAVEFDPAGMITDAGI
jgi:hypothetical protein